ncbi:hypothetical protein L2E82_52154 [Cichorium intybus]|nr:hypothetical protein L2E82_52154 [Cichorium intybus]
MLWSQRPYEVVMSFTRSKPGPRAVRKIGRNLSGTTHPTLPPIGGRPSYSRPKRNCMGSSSRPIDHGTNRVGRPNHHTTRIDANPPRYRTCDSHRIRLAQRLLNSSRAFSSTSPLQSSKKLAFPRRYEMGVFPSPIVCIGLASYRTKEAFWRARACRKADDYIS